MFVLTNEEKGLQAICKISCQTGLLPGAYQSLTISLPRHIHFIQGLFYFW